LKETTQRQIFKQLNNNIENFIGVPDSTMKFFIDEGLRKKKILITTREEEAIGIATGVCLSKKNALVFMQNAGFGNSISTITSLVQLYKIPILFLIAWRGYMSNDAPEHVKFGKIQPQILQTLGLKSKIITDENWKDCCNWAIKEIMKNNPCALVIRRTFHD